LFGSATTAALGFKIGLAGALLAGSAWPQVTERVSVDSSGAQADEGGDLPWPPGAVVSAGGRYVAFFSVASNLVPGDTNGRWDVFVRDRLAGTTERVSVDSNGVQGNANSGLYGIAISADGRYVAFESAVNTLVPGDTNGSRDIFVRDRFNSKTVRVSVDSGGTQGNDDSLYPVMSDDGHLISFSADATNLVPGDTNAVMDVFVHDRTTGTTVRVSVSAGGAQANGASGGSGFSADGRYIVFESGATNLVSGDTNGKEDIFIRDTQNGAVERMSVATNGAQGDAHSYWPTISADGRYVAFTTEATNFAAGDTYGSRDVFVHDHLAGTTSLVSISISGVPGNHGSQEISLSSDGRFAAFKSGATDLIPNGPLNLSHWIFVRDLQAGTTELVSRANDGSIPSLGGSDIPWISADGRYVVFRSYATDLVPGDTNGYTDVFIHDRLSSGFASLCDPGLDGVIGCPCANPPASAGRGCDNSSSTGGARLSAAGNAYLSIDNLVLSTRFERPSATSVVLQGDAPLQSGSAFGQGVRCVGGTLKRL
jgi:Tol biopolymer transport system component